MMTPASTINLLRGLFVTLCWFLGVFVVGHIDGSPWQGGLYGLVGGLVLVLIDILLKGFSLRTFSSATIGLLVGLIFAQLLLASDLLRYQSEEMRWLISVAIYTASGYLAMMLAIHSNKDELSLIIPYVRFRRQGINDSPTLVDTNVIIDGRISQVCATGFLSNSLVVPRFVLEELQSLADSADPLKRERGRRGLENLAQLKLDGGLSVSIYETGMGEPGTVDSKLVELAKLLSARLLTNDLNLCKIARLQNITALNLNELFNALRPSLGAGDLLEVSLVKPGRDSHQAVGYLPDGTMIVVNNALSHIGRTVAVSISSSLQTSAGRLFFAELA